VSTTDIGRRAELCVAEYLSDCGYNIVAQNWRTKWCEIDIIASKQGIVYFVEVKYRKLTVWGDGLDAITDKKLQQMTFAANLWVQTQGWSGDYRLMAVSVYGNPPQIDKVVEL
jgi:uncharacterized protein (TIGR00252 family)